MGTKTEDSEKKEENTNLLDNDTIRKLAREEMDFDQLSPEQKSEFHLRFVEGDEEEVPTEEEEAAAIKAAATNPPAASSNATPPVENNPPAPEAPAVTPVTPNPEVDADKSEILAKLKAEKDSNNTLKQQLESQKKKLASLLDNKVPEPPKIEDELDENLSKVDKWNREVATKLNTHADTEIQNIQKDAVKTEQSLLYSDVSILQTENPELRTSLPVESIDKTYVRFRDGLAGPGATNEQKNEAVNKFFGDSEYRKSREAEGHVFPIKENDWKSYQSVSKLISYRRNGGDPNWDSKSNGNKFADLDVAYYKYKKENGIVPDPVKQAALDAAMKVTDQIVDNQNKPNLLSPEIGASAEGLEGMTEAQAEAWLVDHPTPSTPEEIATLNAILKKWSPSSQTPQNQEAVF